jgi:hypothetical protein
MSFRSAALAGMFSLMVLGCATNQPESPNEARIWREQLERQQQGAREAGRIGYIGNEAPVSQ